MHVFLGYVRTDIEKKRQYFHTAKEEIAGQNLLFLQLASISTVALLLIFFLLTPFIIDDWRMSPQHLLFLPAALFFAVVSSLYARKKTRSYRFVTALCFIFEIVEMIFILLIDIFADAKAPGSFFPPIIIALPALFIFPIHQNYLLFLAFEAAYIALTSSYKVHYIAQYDIFSSIVAFVFSLVIAHTILHLRCTDFDLRLKYQQLSQQDFLSGILNKQTFEEKGRCCMESLTPSSHCALLLLDLDDFKLVNDSLGHYAGDQLLRQIGEFLQHAFRSTDLIGRFGGDEFIVLMKGPMSTAIVEKKASLILQMLRSIQMSGLPKEITCSIGCVVSEDGDTYDELFIKADKALYTAKKNGKNGYHLYS
ncbi:GGDEF domain-containing protein [Mordavella massiliensis]|uniref:GGDEF domain-containing protein n=1 Tax=Mordavella massiliensis TaxID=1871024 RepID=A0A939BGD2_9CLOT|nr:GGDEF domain-containing protein [Mordavella massiliensis]MBM6947935.1 GGDEF domain-containing protein [Mordavella massiliensis]